MKPSLGLRFCAVATLLAASVAACDRGSALEARRVIASPRARDRTDTSTPRSSAATRAVPRTDAPQASSRVRVTLPPPVPANLARARIKLKKIANLSQPLAMAYRKGDNTLYVAEKGGRIRTIINGKVGATIALNISSEVSTGGEQGLLGLAFSPDGAKLYVNFTNVAGDTNIREYAFSGRQANTSTARTVLQVDQPFPNHNGGNLVFGPDNKLYIGLGDGGSGGDPQGNGQNLNALLGKMLRIDPTPPTPATTEQYTIPSDNPFVGQQGKRGEIWAYGLRNPWRYSFDRDTGDLWTADVGQSAWEEIDFQLRSSKGGENYGWNRMEGTHGYGGGTPPSNHTGPIYEYSHDGGNCSITGGYVYRGKRITNLQGAYVFADFCAGKLRAFMQSNGKAINHRFLGPTVANLSSFGQDQAGELYVMSLDGGVYKINPASS